MHIPTPSLRRGSKGEEEKQRQKRKASDTSTVSVDDTPARKRLVKKKSVEEPQRSNSVATTTRKGEEEPPLSPTLPKKKASTFPLHKGSEPDTSTMDRRSASPETQQQTPRRSSRIKESMHKASEAWDKCRPYIERINGTFMPLEPQGGSKAYYHRDGVKT